jgi:hypothetical protein
MAHQAFLEILVCVLNMKKNHTFLMISFLIVGLSGAPGQKGEPGKYKLK